MFSLRSLLYLIVVSITFAPYSFAQSLSGTTDSITGAWNSYNDHLQVVECMYHSETPGSFNISANRGNGDFVKQETFNIAAKGSNHILIGNFVDSLGNGIKDDFGSYSITSANQNSNIENLACLTAFYRFDQNQDVEYAYTVPAKFSSSEATYGFFDSRDLSNQNYQTFNWLSITNPSDTEVLEYSLTIMESGNREVQNFTLLPKKRRDHALHELSVSSGMYKIDIISGEYFSYLSKYLKDTSSDTDAYIFGLANQNTTGIDRTKIQISTTANAQNYVTVGNPFEEDISIKFSIRGASGEILRESNNYTTIKAGTTLEKIYINPILDPTNIGRVGSIYAETENSGELFILKSSFYGKDSSGELVWSYIDIAKEPKRLNDGEVIVSSINKYLNAANFLKLSNTEDVNQTHAHKVIDQAGNTVVNDQVFIPSKSSVDLSLHNTISKDSVGMSIFYGTREINEFTGQLLRVYMKGSEVLYVTPTPLFTNAENYGGSFAGNNDEDGDGVNNRNDNCPEIANSSQSDLDSDNLGDACDDDRDSDSVIASLDCNDLDATKFNNEWYADKDLDGFKDQEEKVDGICTGDTAPLGYLADDTALDNCPEIANNQEDIDNDLLGDACDDVNNNFDEEFSGNINSLSPFRDELTETETTHLLAKIGFGYDEEAFNYAKENGLSALIDKLLDEGVNTELEAEAEAHMLENRAGTLATNFTFINSDGEEVTERHSTDRVLPYINSMKDFWVHQMVKGNPLQERISLIMHNHFAVNQAILINNYTDAYLAQDYLKVLRENSLSSFNEMLIKITEDTSMIRFLNLDTNTDVNTDENYGREFLELFTLKEFSEETGEANYTHDDILSFSKAFTGLRLITQTKTFDYKYTNPETGETNIIERSFNNIKSSMFDPTYWRVDHMNPEEHTYFKGKSYEATAAMNYVQAAGYITQHDQVSVHLGTTLFRTLVSPETNQEIISTLGELVREKQYCIKEILRVILKSEAMFSRETQNTCVKAPIEAQVAFMRASGIPLESKRRENHNSAYDYDTVITLSNDAKNAGQDLLSPPSIFGWSGICGVNREGSIGRGYNWLSGDKLLARNNGIANLLINANRMVQQGDLLWSSLLPSEDATAEETLDYFLTRFGLDYSAEEKAILLEYITHARLSGEDTVEYKWDSSLENFEDFLSLKLPGLFKLLAEDDSFQVI